LTFFPQDEVARFDRRAFNETTVSADGVTFNFILPPSNLRPKKVFHYVDDVSGVLFVVDISNLQSIQVSFLRNFDEISDNM
jgi:hypothetical protein